MNQVKVQALFNLGTPPPDFSYFVPKFQLDNKVAASQFDAGGSGRSPLSWKVPEGVVVLQSETSTCLWRCSTDHG